jgi:hypothetical protein
MFASRLLSEEQNAMPELAEAATCMRIGGFEKPLLPLVGS